VVGQIIPFSFLLVMAGRKTAPALCLLVSCDPDPMGTDKPTTATV
jgi:hypothetical protein